MTGFDLLKCFISLYHSYAKIAYDIGYRFTLIQPLAILFPYLSFCPCGRFVHLLTGMNLFLIQKKLARQKYLQPYHHHSFSVPLSLSLSLAVKATEASIHRDVRVFAGPLISL